MQANSYVRWHGAHGASVLSCGLAVDEHGDRTDGANFYQPKNGQGRPRSDSEIVRANEDPPRPGTRDHVERARLPANTH